MQTFADIAELREQIAQLKREQRRIAFVPTMGNLHEGHLTLMRKARENADVVVASIFVNPMQFERADDLNNYPRTLDDDLSKLTAEGVDLVFTPTPEVMYPQGLDKQTFVEVQVFHICLKGHLVRVTLEAYLRSSLSCLTSYNQTWLALVRKTTSSSH